MAENGALNEWLTKHVEAANELRDLYYKAKRIKGIHASVNLDAALTNDLPVAEARTKAEIDAVLVILDAMVTFIDTNGRLAALEKVSRTV